MVEDREEEMRRLTTPVENESADIEAGCTSQGTSALEAEGKGEIKSQALQGAEDKAKLVSEPADVSVEEKSAADTAAKKVEPADQP